MINININIKFMLTSIIVDAYNLEVHILVDHQVSVKFVKFYWKITGDQYGHTDHEPSPGLIFLTFVTMVFNGCA